MIVGVFIVVIGGFLLWKSRDESRSSLTDTQNIEKSSLNPSPITEPNPHRIQGWIGEGVPMIKSLKKANLPVYQNPGDTELAGSVPVEKGEAINWTESQIITREKGSIMWDATKTVRVVEYRLESGIPLVAQEGSPREQVFEANIPIDYIAPHSAPRPEGAIIVYKDHKYLEIDGTDPAMRITKQPVTEFWVYALITKDAGGWVKVDNDILEISRWF